MTDAHREFMRHTIATLAYRAGRVCENIPPGFADFRASDSTRTAGEILTHMGDLLEWATRLAAGTPEWRPASPLPWAQETDRLFAALLRLDGMLAAETSIACPLERLFQGPIADALTHVGQLSMLRRAAARPMVGENYYRAEITVGRIAKELPAAAAPFS